MINKISDELGEIIRILQLITIDDVLLNEFDEDEQHNLKKTPRRNLFETFFSSNNVFSSRLENSR